MIEYSHEDSLYSCTGKRHLGVVVPAQRGEGRGGEEGEGEGEREAKEAEPVLMRNKDERAVEKVGEHRLSC